MSNPPATPTAPVVMDFDQFFATLEHVRDEQEKQRLKTKLDEFATASPNPAELLLTWGTRLTDGWRMEEALPHLQKANEAAPDRPDVLSALGVALYRLSRTAEASRAFARAAKLLGDAGDATGYTRETLHFIEALIDDGRIKSAKPRMEPAARLVNRPGATDAERAQMLRLEGKMLRREGKQAEAVAAFQAALALDPHPQTVSTLASFEYERGHRYAAATYALSLLRAHPAWFHLPLWTRLFRESNPADRTYFADWFEAKLPHNHWAAEILTSWASVLQEVGLTDRALANFMKATAIGAGYPALVGIAKIHEQQGDRAEALKGYRAAVPEARGNPARAEELGIAFYDLGQWEIAVQQFTEAVSAYEALPAREHLARAYKNLAFALDAWRRPARAIQAFREATRLDPNFRTAWVGLGSTLAKTGAFSSAYQAWERAAAVYVVRNDDAARSREAWHFADLGWLQHEVLGELREAEATYLRGIQLDPDHVAVRVRLVQLYNEKAETPPDDAESQDWRSIARSSGQEHAAHAEAVLRTQLERATNVQTYLELGYLYLTTGVLDRAEENLKRAVALLPDSSHAINDLGVAYVRNEKNAEAIRCFQTAARLDSDNWNARSNLAEAFAKSKQLTRAQEEYERVLAECGQCVEALAGLGETLLAIADDGERDVYDQAVKHLTGAIEHSRERTGSTRLRPSQLASALYSRGYARVQQYKHATIRRDEELLSLAVADFRACLDSDSRHFKATKALEQIREHRRHDAGQRFAERYGPIMVVIMAIVVYAIAQFSFFYPSSVLPSIPAGSYVLLTFTSLAFVVTGLYLPQLLKLKVAGFELEKSTTDLISTTVPLNIKR